MKLIIYPLTDKTIQIQFCERRSLKNPFSGE